MKPLKTLFATLLLTGPSFVAAMDGWYIGEVMGYYVLDADRAVQGDFEGSQLGLQIGKHLSEDFSVEFGYSFNVGHDEFDVASLTSLVWLGDATSKWRSYALVGLNQYNFEHSSNLVAGHDDSSGQIMFGMGVSTMLNKHYQLRTDVRGMSGRNEQGEDIGVQLSINRLFGRKPAPAPAAKPQIAVTPEPKSEPEPELKPEPRTISIRLDVRFEFNKDTVLTLYSEQLSEVATAMRTDQDIDLLLQGHTDSRGSDSYNMALSERRVRAVKAKLVADYGIAAERIATLGYGESRPVASNQTEAGRARNRRVVGEMSFSEVVVD